MKYLNPLAIVEADLPLICFSDDRRGFLGWLIKAHTSGQYSHAMEMVEPHFFASQNFTGYKKVPIQKYMKPSILLKFYQPKDLSDKKKRQWKKEVEKELAEPWWKRRYDYIGAVVGQILPWQWFRKINNPWTKYCSERVAGRLRRLLKMIIPLHRNPSELNAILKMNPKVEVLGYYFSD